MKRSAQVLLVIIVALFTLGADFDRARFEKVGLELMCTCGCQQVLLECNHVGCQVSDGMRNKVQAGIVSGKSNDAVLASFVDEFGPTVLAAPTKTGFNRVAWIMPFVVFALGITAAIYFVRKWQHRLVAAKPQPAISATHYQELVQQARQETEI
ncbi:MAG TPA: cytochrome c-type biogenesis protein CcmH [Terriglobales bacterium]|nr:cytochrome c-type biogenesis protein CcmH [Terriglobales bacterium]